MTVVHRLQTMPGQIDLVVQSGTSSRYILTDCQGESQQSVHVGLNKIQSVSYRITLHDAARFELLIALTQVQDCTIDINLDLQGSGAQADVLVLYGLSGQQSVKINSLQKHQGKKTTSNFVARGIVIGQAHVAYQGMILLQPGSAQADAKQEHTTIVLSKQAKVVSIPSIEVLHHDVQCSHGAAIGQFHEQQLWYLQSRGFEKDAAYKMLVHSFFAEHVHRFSLPCHSRLDLESSDKKICSDQLLESLCQKIL